MFTKCIHSLRVHKYYYYIYVHMCILYIITSWNAFQSIKALVELNVMLNVHQPVWQNDISINFMFAFVTYKKSIHQLIILCDLLISAITIIVNRTNCDQVLLSRDR